MMITRFDLKTLLKIKAIFLVTFIVVASLLLALFSAGKSIYIPVATHFDNRLAFGGSMQVRVDCETNVASTDELISLLLADAKNQRRANIMSYSLFEANENFSRSDFLDGISDFYGSFGNYENFCTYRTKNGYKSLVEYPIEGREKRGVITSVYEGDQLKIKFEAVSQADAFDRSVAVWWSNFNEEKYPWRTELQVLKEVVFGKRSNWKALQYSEGGAVLFELLDTNVSSVEKYAEFYIDSELNEGLNKLLGIVSTGQGAIYVSDGEPLQFTFSKMSEGNVTLIKAEDTKFVAGLLSLTLEQKVERVRDLGSLVLVRVLVGNWVALTISFLIGVLVSFMCFKISRKK